MSGNELTLPGVDVHPSAVIDPDARIYPSIRGTRIVVGAGSHVYAFAIIRAVGGQGDVTIGEDCHINPHCVLYSGSGITIGNHVLLAPHVCVVPANHSFQRRDIPIAKQGFIPSKGGVVIEDDVWIGAQTVLLDGAYIERGAIVGAGSVVGCRVPAFSVWGGAPARQLKMRP